MMLTSLCTFLLLFIPWTLSAAIDPRADKVTITIFDCSPTTHFKSYRLVCSDSPESDDENTCLGQQASEPLSPPSGGLGIGTFASPDKDDIPTGCEYGVEGLGPVGILDVEVGTEIWFGIVLFTDVETEGSEISVKSEVARCQIVINEYPGDNQLYWWFNAPEPLEGPFAASNGQLKPGAVDGPKCWGTLGMK